MLWKLTLATLAFGQSSGTNLQNYRCDSTCRLPACKCVTMDPPIPNPPQFVLITFDDAINDSLMPQVNSLLNRRNPNGCRAKGTWFAQALYSNPATMTQWYAQGHEIADHSFTHSAPYAGSRQELQGLINFANRFGGIPRGRIKGVRFPFRNYTRESMDYIKSLNFEYDSSTATQDLIWPYTMDFGIVNECLGQNSLCGVNLPNAKGVWQVPMYGISSSAGQHLMDIYNDFSITNPISDEVVFNTLTEAFQQRQRGNKAPLGIYMHPVWLGKAQPGIPDGTSKLENLNRFLNSLPRDVWFVTTNQLVQYMKNPVPASELGNQPYMQCFTGPSNICNGVSMNGVESCPFGNLQTCYGCPSSEPNLQNPTGGRSNSQRCVVPDNCDTLYWDPVGCRCLCDNPSCAWKDDTPLPSDGTNTTTPGTDGKKNNAQKWSTSILGLLSLFL